jgi:hypothetical protein
MKKLILTTTLGLTLAAGIAAQAEEGPGLPVPVSIARAYVPQGFDNNDRAEVTIEGYFPNTCYRMGPTTAQKNEKGEIEVTQTAYVYKGHCLMMIVPYQQSVSLGVLANEGQYRVMDGLSKQELGVMPVAKSKTTGPDDFMYAHVDDAYITYIEPGRRAIVINANLPGNCWTMTDKKVFLEGNDVLTVLPIMEQTSEDNCVRDPVPFTAVVDVPQLDKGRYLLNVRSLNGQSVNKLFDVQ